MRIALAIVSLEPGGAERVLSLLATHWSGKSHEVAVVTLSPDDADFYALPHDVSRVSFGGTSDRSGPLRPLLRRWREVMWMRAQLRTLRPDVVVSFLAKVNLLVLVASLGLPIPVVVSERVDPERQPWPPGLGLLRKRLYRRAVSVVVQTNKVSLWARSFLKPERLWVIPNPAVAAEQVATSEDRGSSAAHTVVSAGRLHHQKGFDLLLEAFALSARKHPTWSLLILGEGPERGTLRARASSLGISDRVEMPGVSHELGAALASADLFVLSSRWEGFPNVLLEAMAAGLPVVSFDCPSGPAEIITQDENGILVRPEDAGALAGAMDRLMSDETERKRLGEAAKGVTERFSQDKVMSKWDELLEKVTEDKTR